MIHWRKREEHPAVFDYMEKLLVAYRPIPSAELLCMATIKATTGDEYPFECEACTDTWFFDWEDVVYWCPLSEIENTLPKG